MDIKVGRGCLLRDACAHLNPAIHCSLSKTRITRAPPRRNNIATNKSRTPWLHSRQVAPLAAQQQQQQLAKVDAPGQAYFTPQDCRPIILFDGVCNLCNGGVNTMLQLDPGGIFRFAALQSAAGKTLLQRSGRAPDDISSIVLVEENASYIKSEAILRIAQRLKIPLVPFPLLAAAGLGVPKGFRDFVYDQVADNRYDLLGKRTACRLSDDRFADRFLV